MKIARGSKANKVEGAQKGPPDLNGDQLLALVNQAASDDAGGGATPELFFLIDKSLGNAQEGLRYRLANASIEFIERHLERVGHDQTVTFWNFLSQSGLCADFHRLRGALEKYVTQRIAPISRGTANFAVLLLKSSVGQTVARKWLSKLTEQMNDAPSWHIVDVLAEMYFILQEDYPRSRFLEDINKLRAEPEFKSEVEVRLHKWARLNLIAQEIIDPPRVEYRPNGELIQSIHRMHRENSGVSRKPRLNS